MLTNAFTDDGPVGAVARAELARDAHWAGPEHLLVEAFSAVRGRWLGRKIGEDRAVDALTALAAAAINLVSVRPLLDRMWELRDNVTGYDAAYSPWLKPSTAPCSPPTPVSSECPGFGAQSDWPSLPPTSPTGRESRKRIVNRALILARRGEILNGVGEHPVDRLSERQ